MAQQAPLDSSALGAFTEPLCRVRLILRRISFLAGALISAALLPAHAQTPPQQYVYGSVPVTTTSAQVAGYSKNAQTGALSPIPGSPFADRLQGASIALDGKGRFLFVVNQATSNISMFQVDQSTGALTEVPASPFSTGPADNSSIAPTSPVCLAADKSGRFLYVGYQFGNVQGRGAINEYLIDATSLQLVPLPGQQTTDVSSSPIGMFTDPKGLHLYVGLGPNQSTGSQDAGTNVYSIDSTSGQLVFTGLAGNAVSTGRSIAIDPQGRFFFDGWGTIQSFIDTALISPADGTATTGISTLGLAFRDSPLAMLTESSGKFLYVQQSSGPYVYLIDPITGALTQQSALTALSFAPGTAAADPLGPYIYSLQKDGVHAFLIDGLSGALSEIPGSPFSLVSGAVGPLTISGAPIQAASGPAATLFPATEDFGNVTLGQASASRLVTLTNTGDQGLGVNSITVSGTDSADFTATPNCSIPTVLQPNATCTVSVIFVPALAGTRSATLTASDNAPGSPQSVSLSGIGLATQPAVTLIPGTLSFAATVEGSDTQPQTITLTSAGTAELHISSVLLGGSNPSDFSLTNACSGAYALNATCTISIVFTPRAAGLRAATLTITDDAPDSPQNLAISGTGLASLSALTLSPGTLSFGSATQGSQTAPQAITVTSTGTAALHISSVLLGGADPSDFTMINSCNGAYAVNAACTISVTFAPLSTGSRGATITIADDAPNAPHTISLSGVANPAYTVAPMFPNGTSVTISAGQTAIYNLQLIPNPGFSGNISFGCSGAPLAANCSAPPVQLTGMAPVPFTINVTTAGSAVAVPFFETYRVRPTATLRWLLPLILLAIALLFTACHPGRVRRIAMGACSATLLCISALHLAGCGAAGTPAPAPVISRTVTPQGTSTLTVAPSALSASGKPLQLSQIQLTLIVK